MKKNVFIIAAIGICISFSSTAWSYDAKMAESYAKLFASVDGAKAGKELHFVKPDGYIKDIHAGKKIVAIDVRTTKEAALFGMTLPGSLAIPINELFKPENLKRIPTNKPVMIVCKSGARATAAGTALRHTGFDNIYILKGGFQALSKAYGPKKAYPAKKGKK
ncbi:MAG: rhodanese-like domain-containing protein [Candidatus Electrothrix sp. AR4]|nr:rhodanese-like domain-containing protein [Candidatus Electrothrix sp. AR4]